MTSIQYSGASEAAEFIRSEMKRNILFLQKSSAIGTEQVVRGELAETWEECSKPNWDGYGGLPVTWDAYNNAERFLNALPLGVPLPSVGAEPDGHVVLDWYHSRRRSLSLSISPDNELHYAALLGPGRVCGSEPFFGEIPKLIVDLIAQIHAC